MSPFRIQDDEISSLNRFIVENASEAILTFDSDGKMMDANKMGCRYLGYDRNALLSMHIYDIDRHFTRANWPQHWSAMSRAGNEVIETEHRCKDGSYVPVEVAINFVCFKETDFCCAFVRDMSSHRRAEQELREREELFRQLAEHIREVFWLYDQINNKTLYISPACQEIWGRPVTSFYQPETSLRHAAHDEDRDRVLRAFIDEAPGGDYDETYRIVRPDGTTRWIRDRGFPIRDELGTVYRIAGIAEDITRSKMIEDERMRLETQLRQAQKMEAIGQLTGGIAHDFNNILACILGYTDLALELYGSDPKSKLTKYLTEVFRAGERARELVAQMLLFSRGGKGDAKPLFLQDAAKETLKMLKSMLPTTIMVEFNEQDGTPAVQIDPVQCQQLIMNLSLNASVAMGVHGTLAIDIATVSLENGICSSCHGGISGNWVQISVTDTGNGIAESIRSKIFEPFFTTKEVGKGSGMGLAVAHGIVHEHAGHIIVETETGQGSTFKILFQSVEETAQTRARTEAALKRAAHEKGGGGWILVVDDEHAIAGLMRDILKSWGYEVACLTDSTKALERFRESPDLFDLVITDQTMPKMTGMELAAHLREIRKDTPVILCTGYSELVDEEGARDLNIRGYLHKPLELPRFSKLVKKLVNR